MRQFEKDSNRMLTKIKKDLSNLLEKGKIENRNIEDIHNELQIVHKQLYELESSLMKQRTTQQIEDDSYSKEGHEDNLVFKRKIVIKKTKPSRSFKAWVFNNRDM